MNLKEKGKEHRRKMELYCKHCSYIAKSLLIDQKLAIREIIEAFAKHTMDKSKHPKLAQEIVQDTMKATQLSTTIIMLAKHTTLLDLEWDENDVLLADFAKVIDEMQEALGIEINGPDEDEDKEDDEDTLPIKYSITNGIKVITENKNIDNSVPAMVDSQSADETQTVESHPAD